MEKNWSFSPSFKNGASLGHWSARFDEPDDVHQNEIIIYKFKRETFYFRLRFIFAAEIEEDSEIKKGKTRRKNVFFPFFGIKEENFFIIDLWPI